jgi:putative oxygen-independent coproporphyrinogen III oxidase
LRLVNERDDGIRVDLKALDHAEGDYCGPSAGHIKWRQMACTRNPFSLYIHIPYCISKCPYCDFNSHVVAAIPEEQYTDGLLGELEYFRRLHDWQDRPVQSIFFGGGTPSTFMPRSIGRILERVRACFPLERSCEITLEGNPTTVDQRNFAGYRDAGVNRISVGVQSFQPRLLKFLGRVHSADDARTALQAVTQVGFENFSFDLIYANPGQTLAELEADLDTALEFQSPHLSAYNLTFEEGTPFHHEYQSGRLSSLGEEEEIAMAELIQSKLQRAGLKRYEISNYARPGRESRHNVNYWRGGDYLGLGAGAHSYRKIDSDDVWGRRWSNEKNPGRYMALISDANCAIVEREEINQARAAGEFMFLGLRMRQGVSATSFRSRFGRSPAEFFPQIADWLEAELMEESADYLYLTYKGMMVANSIFVQLL